MGLDVVVDGGEVDLFGEGACRAPQQLVGVPFGIVENAEAQAIERVFSARQRP